MLEPSKLTIYEASAGAGKTYTLVKEFLSIVLSSKDPHKFKSLLAITFTNKATLEMKSRIVEWLIDFSRESETDPIPLVQISKELSIPVKELKLRSKRVLSQILHSYSQFSVSTIDKFNLRLMKSFARDFDLSLGFEVELDIKEILSRSVMSLYKDLKKGDNLTHLLVEYVLEQLENDKKWDFTESLISDAQQFSGERFFSKVEGQNELTLEDWIDFRKKLFLEIHSSKKELLEIGDNAVGIIKEKGILPTDFYRGKQGIYAFFERLSKRDFRLPNSYQVAFIEGEKLYGSKTTQDKKQLIDAIHPQLSTLGLKAEQIMLKYKLNIKLVKNLPVQSLYSCIQEHIEKIKQEDNILLISDFNKLISEHLRKQPVPYIYEKLGSRYHHYFIDEFQDTSSLQWNNMLPLVDNSLAENGTSMLVGDVKQSIYRFRGGNSSLLLGLMKKEVGTKLKSLDTNYRSFSEVIHFNNDFYAYISSVLLDESYREVYQKAFQKQNDKKGGLVQLNLYEKDRFDKEVFNQNVFNKLKNNIQQCLSDGFELDEMAILVRNKKEASMIADYLSLEAIDVVSDEALLVSNSQVVQTIEYFVRFWTDPEDKESLALFCLMLCDQQKLITKDISEYIFTLKSLSLEDILESLLEKGFDMNPKSSLSIYEQIEGWVNQMQYSTKESAYVSAFLDFVFEYSAVGKASLSGFLEHWEKHKPKLSVVLPESLSAVRLLTIHKSKGLEYKVVMLPVFRWDFKRKHLWIPFEDPKISQLYVDSWTDLENLSTEVDHKIREEEVQLEMDNVNLLYVATTRAVERLYLLMEAPKKAPSNNIEKYFHGYLQSKGIVPSASEDLILSGSGERRQSKAKAKGEAPKELCYEPSVSQSKVNVAYTYHRFWKQADQKEYLKYGKLLHAILAEVETEKDVPSAIEGFLLEGVISKEESEKLKGKIVQVIQHPMLLEVFKKEHKILNEREYINRFGELLRPDRVVETDHTIYIVDYKTGEAYQKYHQQLETYAELFTASNKTVVKYLVYLLEQGVEVEQV